MQTLTQTCRMTGKEFEITDLEQRCLEKVGRHNPVLGSPLPLPLVHPHEFSRLLFCRISIFPHLYRDRSVLSNKPLISCGRPGQGVHVVSRDEFWSDAVDNTLVGRPYDFTRPFYEQWRELALSAYQIPLYNVGSENSEFANDVENLKNCYLCFSTVSSQDCLYCVETYDSRDCIDCNGITNCSYCYDCVESSNCYECASCEFCRDTSFSFGCKDLVGCQYCLGCAGLRQERYCLFNRRVSKEEYESFLAGSGLNSRQSRSALLQRCRELFRDYAANTLFHCEDCSGHCLSYCKSTYESYFSSHLRDCGHYFFATRVSDSWRGAGVNAELLYEAAGVNTYCAAYSSGISGGECFLYCADCVANCAHCFGCLALKHNSYCVLNRQYSKTEYMDLVPRIIKHMQSTGEWGRFFDPRASLHAYHESSASQLLPPLSAQEAKARGYVVVEPQPEPEGAASNHQPPDSLLAADLEQAAGARYRCAATGKIFTFQANELAFHKRHGIPLPDVSWQARLRALIDRRGVLPGA